MTRRYIINGILLLLALLCGAAAPVPKAQSPKAAASPDNANKPMSRASSVQLQNQGPALYVVDVVTVSNNLPAGRHAMLQYSTTVNSNWTDVGILCTGDLLQGKYKIAIARPANTPRRFYRMRDW